MFWLIVFLSIRLHDFLRPCAFSHRRWRGRLFFRQLFLREGDRIKEGKHYASLHLLSNSLNFRQASHSLRSSLRSFTECWIPADFPWRKQAAKLSMKVERTTLYVVRKEILFAGNLFVYVSFLPLGTLEPGKAVCSMERVQGGTRSI